MAKITERLKQLITQCTSEAKKFKELEELTGITSGTWRSWWNRNGTPSGEMIEAASLVWPQHAFWLATGVDDSSHGHDAPAPMQHYRVRTAARDLFLAKVELNRWMESNPFTKEDQERYLDAMASEGSIESQTAANIERWIALSRKVDELAEIRDAQEASLEKFETDQISKAPLPLQK